MNRVKLKDIAYYSEERINTSLITKKRYISTDNMLAQKGGIIEASNLPNSKTVLKCEIGDTLISNIRPYFKKIYLADSVYGVSSDVLIIKTQDESLVDKRFLYYTLSRDYFFKYVMVSAKGSKMPRGDKDMIMNFEINLPDLPTQVKIADLLSSLDDKIEINNKINQELEELGQALYTKWFVNFDFPNEEGKPYKSSGGEMIESELGMIPKGWKVGAIGDGVITKIIGSGINKFESTKKYLATANVSISSIINHEKISYSNRPSRANMQPKSNTVWFAKMKDTKKILSISDFDSDIIDEYIFSTGFAGVECLNDSIYYVWNFINNEKFELTKNSLSNGSTQKSINNENISKIKMIIPTNELLTSYYNLMYNSMKQISLNKLENKKLEELRDFLIPQLMSGNLEIKDIDNTEKEV